MDISLFDFNLPSELIAQFPSNKRDESRLMIVDRKEQTIRHSIFKDIVNELDKNSLLVLNNSKVINSRLLIDGDGKKSCEIFVHKIFNESEFFAFLRPHKRFRQGDKISLDKGFEVEIIELDRENITNRLRVTKGSSIYEIMRDIGHIPLPPYIKRADIREIDGNRYQTVYAQKDGSVAAPTAGLHFTDEVFQSLSKKDIDYEFITLYVGIGTFAPVRTNDIIEHKMHSEDYEIPEEAARKINTFMNNNGRIVAVGTTSVRTLESNYLIDKKITSGFFSTDIFIYPSFKFNVVDSMITNFHLPKSTLFMLVCAFAGRELMLYAYNEAIKERYRFFSYGDAMLIK